VLDLTKQHKLLSLFILDAKLFIFSVFLMLTFYCAVQNKTKKLDFCIQKSGKLMSFVPPRKADLCSLIIAKGFLVDSFG
jgi:hypothetical protein